MSAAELLERARRAAPETGFIVYTGYATPAALGDALDAGARGVIVKDAPLPDLVRAIRIVAGGGRYVDAGFQAGEGVGATLTARERDVLRLLADGLSNEETAKRLFISPETVRTHVQKSMAKLGARTRVEAVATALRRSLIS
jgi:DNA-binding NarL/FixJ family response regulator